MVDAQGLETRRYFHPFYALGRVTVLLKLEMMLNAIGEEYWGPILCSKQDVRLMDFSGYFHKRWKWQVESYMFLEDKNERPI